VVGWKKWVEAPAHNSMYGRAELPFEKAVVSKEKFWPHFQIFSPGVLVLSPTRTTPLTR
jgi:hypothetical protein